MKKYIVMFAFLLLLSVFVTSQYEQHTHNAAAQSKNEGYATLWTAQPPKTNSNTDQPKWYAPRGDRAYSVFGFPNGITVWALFLTLIVIADQTTQTKQAATAARDGVLLQETAFYQWIEIVNWRSAMSPHVLMPTIGVSAEITNLTNFPLTLKSASITFGIEPSTTTFLVGEGRFLPPKSPVKIEVRLPINPAKRTSFDQNSLGIPITGCFQFIGILKKVATQDLGGVLICG